jgi:redox-sensitive bicupin YhaK (pirin superfamily)
MFDIEHSRRKAMIQVQPFAKLGQADFGWLKARHHFSFGQYHDAARMGFGALRVWNDDEIAPNTGFDPHPHRDMEIITYVRQGAITHQDNLGNTGRTEAGDVQVMSAGTGVVHAEYNKEPRVTKIFQIWIIPEKRGVQPAWGAARFPEAGRDAFTVLASGHDADVARGALKIQADASLSAATVKAGESVTYALAPGRKAYLVPAKGAATVNGVAVNTRDGAAIADENAITVTATEDAELVLVDVEG